MASAIRIKKKYSTALVVLILLLLISGLVYWAYQANLPSHETSYANHDPDVAYVGMAKCAECHGDKHSTFVHTGMGLSFDYASLSKSSAQFGKEHIVYDSTLDMYYYPYWKNEELYIQEFRLKGKDTVHQLDVGIDYIVGSGQHTNSHIIEKNGYVYQAPITFYVQKGKWDLAPGFENGNNSRFDRLLNVECMSCHNAMPEMVGKSQTHFETIGTGIDCERCHGPGGLHVEEREQGKGVDVSTTIDPTIVNPRKLSWERQIDLCQRCHLQGLNLLQDGKKFTDFKPGMKLSDVFEVYLPQFEGEVSEFDMANHAQRFQQSACFIQGNKESLDFTCISCHNPHVSVKMTSDEVYNSACMQCHQDEACTASKADIEAEANKCVTCHMPQKGSEDIPHVSVHDHFIRVPSVEKGQTTPAQLKGLYAVNNATPSKHNEIRAYLEYWEKFDKNPFFLNKAEKMLKENTYPNLQLKYHYLKGTYTKALDLKYDEEHFSAWENFMLGRCYVLTDKASLGYYYINKAYIIDTTNRMVASELLRLMLAERKLAEALPFSEKLVKAFSYDGVLASRRAKALIMTGNISEAKEFVDKAIQLEPDDIDVWVTQLNYYALLKDKAAFEFWAQKIMTKDKSKLNAAEVRRLLSTM